MGLKESNMKRFLAWLFNRKEQLPMREQWRLTARYKGTDIIAKVIEGENIICAVGKGLLGDMFIDKAGYDTGLTYQAIGTSDTAVGDGDTILTAEAARKAITYKSRLVNVVTYSTFFTAGESTFNIKEAGIFGHSTASVTPGSGIIFSHWLVAFDNSAGTYDLTFDYVLTIG